MMIIKMYICISVMLFGFNQTKLLIAKKNPNKIKPTIFEQEVGLRIVKLLWVKTEIHYKNELVLYHYVLHSGVELSLFFNGRTHNQRVLQHGVGSPGTQSQHSHRFTSGLMHISFKEKLHLSADQPSLGTTS